MDHGGIAMSEFSTAHSAPEDQQAFFHRVLSKSIFRWRRWSPQQPANSGCRRQPAECKDGNFSAVIPQCFNVVDSERGEMALLPPILIARHDFDTYHGIAQ